MGKIVFIGAMERSGINLIRKILNSHPEVAAGPQTGVVDEISRLYSAMALSISNGNLGAYLNTPQMGSVISNLIERVYSPYSNKEGKTIVVDCSPRNLWNFPLLAELLPEAKFLHIIRDGRDVACSYRDVGARASAKGVQLEQVAAVASKSIERCSTIWADTVRFGWDHCGPDSQLARSGRAFTTFYENIVLSPESQIRNICEFLGIEFTQTMLHPERLHHDSILDGVYTLEDDQNAPITMLSAGRWIDHLSLKDRIVFYAQGHVGLRLAGYDDSVQWLFRGLNIPISSGFEALEQARSELLGDQTARQESNMKSQPSQSLSKLALERSVVGATGTSISGRMLPEIEAIMRVASQSGSPFLQG